MIALFFCANSYVARWKFTDTSFCYTIIEMWRNHKSRSVPSLSLFPDKNRGTGGEALPFWVFHPEDKKAPLNSCTELRGAFLMLFI
jgi:hypothetical protein